MRRYTPTLDEALALAGRPGLIPVHAELLADLETPVSAYCRLAYDAQGRRHPYAFILESVEGGDKVGRYSFIGTEPLCVIERRGDTVTVREAGGNVSSFQTRKDSFRLMHELMAKYHQHSVPGLPPFSGGAVGYASYETIQEIEPRVRCKDKPGLDTPDACFMICDTLVAFDRVRQRLQIIAHMQADAADPKAAYAAACARIESVIARLMEPRPVSPAALPDCPPVACGSNMSREQFLAAVARVRDYVFAGDVIQAVLSQRFEVEGTVEPVNLLRALRSINPSPYMFCLQLGPDLAAVGASPEVHARCQDGEVTVRPIAGTRRRGATEAVDLALAAELLADPKERAEHIMLVDLARNDIGRIAATGQVTVPQLMTIERYSHVLHIVSEVRGQLLPGLDRGDVMASTFPAGTVSGAPKVRAMEIIAELEGQRRGIYAGAICYFSFNGNVDSCIAIRTAVLQGGRTYVQAGAGIVADSDLEAEYEETRSKAQAMLVAINAASTLPQPFGDHIYAAT